MSLRQDQVPAIVSIMLLLYVLVGASAVIELLILAVFNHGNRRILSSLLVLITAIITVAFFFALPIWTACLLAIISFYKLVNLARFNVARMNERYLSRATLTTSIWLIAFQVCAVAVDFVVPHIHFGTAIGIITLFTGDTIICLTVLLSTTYHLYSTRWRTNDEIQLVSTELPTLTVAIPARNETEDLEACLQSVIESQYPKLEVLVLDDCSQDKRTPEIIRSYAHNGVRFLQGEETDRGWLAKNQAYQQLYQASSGEYILFCGVDVRFKPETLGVLIEAMIRKNKSMVSLIPKNQQPTLTSLLVQPMRYAWELSFPRKLFRRPAVLSTCWIIRRSLLENSGGFAAVSRSIVPESYFARTSMVHDGYSFWQSGQRLGVSSAKGAHEQIATAIRTRYPQVHRRIELVLILTILELGVLVMPIACAVFNVLSIPYYEVEIVLTIGLLYSYFIVASLAFRRVLVSSFLLAPIALLLDACLINYSMIRYEFFDVQWKGRNICIPVMRLDGKSEQEQGIALSKPTLG